MGSNLPNKYSVFRIRPEEYNPLTGVWERHVKDLDNFTIADAANSVTSSTVLSSTILPSDKNAILTAISVGSDNMATATVVGSSAGTLFSATCEDDRTIGLSASNENNGFAYIPAGETVSLVVETLGGATSSTLTAHATFKLEPVLANLETE